MKGFYGVGMIELNLPIAVMRFYQPYLTNDVSLWLQSTVEYECFVVNVATIRRNTNEVVYSKLRDDQAQHS